MYEIRYTKHAIKDIKKLKQANLDQKVKNLIEVIRKNPFEHLHHMKSWLVI